MSREQNERANLINRARDLFSPYLDDQITPEERQLVESVLVESPALQAELDSLRHTVKLVRGMSRVSAPRPFTLTAVDAGLESAQPEKASFFATWFKPLMGAMAVLTAIIIVGVFAFTLTTNQTAQNESIAFAPVMQQMAKEAASAEVAEDVAQPQASTLEEPAAEIPAAAPMQMSKAVEEEAITAEAESVVAVEEFAADEAGEAELEAPEVMPMMSAVAPDVAMDEGRGGGSGEEPGEPMLMGAAAPAPSPDENNAGGAANALSEAGEGAMGKSAEVEPEILEDDSAATESGETAFELESQPEPTIMAAAQEQVTPAEADAAVEAPPSEKAETSPSDNAQSTVTEAYESIPPSPDAASEPASGPQMPIRLILLVVVGLLVLGSIGVAVIVLSGR